MSQIELGHPHVVAAWLYVRLDGPGEMKTVLAVETSLNLDPNDRAYDEGALVDLSNKIWEYLASHRHIEAAEIVPIKIV